MDDDLDKAMEDFRQEIADAQGYGQGNEGARGGHTAHTKTSTNPLANRKNLIYGGIGVLILIFLIALFSGSGDKSFKDDLLFIKAKFEQVESKLAHIEELGAKVAHLEKQQKELQQFIRDAVKSGEGLAEQIRSLSQKVETTKKGTASMSGSKAKHSAGVQKKSASANNKSFHEVRSGDTLYSIAKTYGITLDELCRLNNISRDQAIQPGQKLLLAPGINQ
jgi:LysM repeat protein